MDQQQVKEHFRRQVHEYEDFMGRIVPAYDFQTRLLIDLIPFEISSQINVLDLGSGPGILSERALERYPNATVVAFDLTQEMLESARERCAGFGGRLITRPGNFATDDFGSGYDLILAGLTLHHLDDKQRQAAFQKIFLALKVNGVFLAREAVADDDPFVANWHYRYWREFMSGNGEDGDLWYQMHLSKDHPASVEKQMRWLGNSGFDHIACHWRHMNFAILSAHKMRSGTVG